MFNYRQVCYMQCKTWLKRLCLLRLQHKNCKSKFENVRNFCQFNGPDKSAVNQIQLGRFWFWLSSMPLTRPFWISAQFSKFFKWLKKLFWPHCSDVKSVNVPRNCAVFQKVLGPTGLGLFWKNGPVTRALTYTWQAVVYVKTICGPSKKDFSVTY